jgi:hypothetical protein
MGVFDKWLRVANIIWPQATVNEAVYLCGIADTSAQALIRRKHSQHDRAPRQLRAIAPAGYFVARYSSRCAQIAIQNDHPGNEGCVS